MMGESREELGYVPSNPKLNKEIMAHFNRQGLDSVVLEKAREIAFRNFPVLGPGESLSVLEIKRRLFEIGQTGYTLDHYNHMTEKQALEYLLKVRKDLSEAVKHR